MEVILLLSTILTIITVANVYGAAIHSSSDVIALNPLTPAEREILYNLEQDMIRKKRSEDLLSIIKAKLTQGIKSKIGHIASASSHASHGKKDHKEHYYHHHYGPPPEHHDFEHEHHHEEEKSFDFWDLQKSILNTLLQAVKAIKGGLIAIKGHLIKGGGYIISAKGKLISAKGEAITNLGKHIASSALLIPHHKHKEHHTEAIEHEYEHHEHHEHPPSSIGYTAPGAHEIDLHSHHSPPSLSGYADHKLPPSFEAYKDHLPKGAHHGILILKKIPKGHKDKHKGNEGSHSDSHISHHKPEDTHTPPFHFLPDMKDIFAASTYKGHDDSHHSHHHSSSAHSHHEYSDDEHSHDHHYESHPEHHDHHEHHEDSHDHKHHHYPSSDDHDSSSHYESHSDSHDAPHLHYNIHPHKYEHASNDHYTKHSGPPATNYGTPIGSQDNNDYKIKLLNSFSNAQSTGGLSDYQTKLEAYEPLQLPTGVSQPFSTSGVSNLGLQNFQTYPLDLSHSFGAQQKLLGNFLSARKGHSYSVHEPSQEPDPDSDTSESEHEIVLTARIPSKSMTTLHRFPALIVTSDSFKDFLLAQQKSRNRQTSQTRSVSRRKRPKNYEFHGTYHLGPNEPVKTD